MSKNIIANVPQPIFTQTIMGNKRTESNIDNVVKEIAELINLPISQLFNGSRKVPIVWYRHLIFYIAFFDLKISLQEIANKFNFNHSTVFNGIEKTKDRLITEPGIIYLYKKYNNDKFIKLN